MENEAKLYELVQKLFALGEHADTPEHEAQNALEKAQAILLKHNLTRAQVIAQSPAETPAGIGKIERFEREGYVWKRQLLNVLAQANLCRVIGSPSQKKATLFGSYDNVRAVLEMYEYIVPILSWEANKQFREYKNDEGRERGQTWKASFLYGATQAIKERLQKPIEVFAQGDGKALVVQNTAAVKAAIHKIYPNLTSGRRVIPNGSGYGAGNGTGRGMNLTPTRRLNGGTLMLT